MDDFDLMEPLSYEDEEEDYVPSGKKRRGTETILKSAKTFKRQKINEQQSPIVHEVEDDDDNLGLIIDESDTEGEVLSARSNSANVVIIDLDEEKENLDSNRNGSRILHDEKIKNIPGQSTAGHKPLPRTFNTHSFEPTDMLDLDLDTDDTIPKVRHRRVLKFIPHNIPYVPVTCQDGTRLYLRIKETSNDIENEGKPLSVNAAKNEDLIKNWDLVKAEAKLLKDKFRKEVINKEEKDISVVAVKDNDTSNMDSLWVEKYKPKAFFDLLSQENVNSALLHWLKLWDKSVFGIDYLVKVKATREKYAQLEAMEKEKDEIYHRKSYLPTNENYDEGGRPCVKVALLSGDPGLGKTTCAHIIARHAGYNVREVNASDDRSVELFRKMLDDTTQSKAEIFHDGKPNCLIIDEIDGAPLPSVNVLVELTLGNATENGKKKAKKVLRRPVICICNDLYATSLKILKKHAFVLQFPRITIPRLLERLNEVSDNEKLFLDSNTLNSLCQKSECDIRSCLSTLQFLKRKRCTAKEALFSQVGMKDKSKGIFSVWNDIFSLPEEKKYSDLHDPSKPDFRFRHILQVAQSYGEYEKLLGGVTHNYLKVKFRDSYMQSVLEGLEWTAWFEQIREYIERTQTYTLYGYLPMYFVMSHFLYARRHPEKLQFPSYEMANKLPKFQQAIKSQITETTVSTGRFLDPHMLITDVFPAVLNIIQPTNIRPVPQQIWTNTERETLSNVVKIMGSYNLCYTQTKNPETGAYSYVLEPDLDDMLKFQLQDTISKKPFPYAIKQLISREIDIEKLRRNDMTPEIVQRESFKQPETPKSSAKTKSNFLEVQHIKSPVTPVSVPRDFFGRPIIQPIETSPEAEIKKKSETQVYFRFKEGFSNAVRRYVKIRDLC